MLTALFNIPNLLEIVARWDRLVRAQLPPDVLWYATLSRDGMNFTGKTRAGENRRSAVAKGLESLCDRAGIPYLPPHSLRHGHALFALERATSIAAAKTISQNLMHDSLTTTEKIYGKLKLDNVRKHIAALTDPEKLSSDVTLDAIVRGFSGNPGALLDPLADALAKRLFETPNNFVDTLAKATASRINVIQIEGALSLGHPHLSGRRDLNPGPLQPHCSALAKLRHAPYTKDYNKECAVWQVEIGERCAYGTSPRRVPGGHPSNCPRTTRAMGM